MTDVIALKKRIEASGMTVTYVAERSGMLRETLYNRMKTGDFKAVSYTHLTLPTD